MYNQSKKPYDINLLFGFAVLFEQFELTHSVPNILTRNPSGIRKITNRKCQSLIVGQLTMLLLNLFEYLVSPKRIVQVLPICRQRLFRAENQSFLSRQMIRKLHH